jgi:hypothetical protein
LVCGGGEKMILGDSADLIERSWRRKRRKIVGEKSFSSFGLRRCVQKVKYEQQWVQNDRFDKNGEKNKQFSFSHFYHFSRELFINDASVAKNTVFKSSASLKDILKIASGIG